MTFPAARPTRNAALPLAGSRLIMLSLGWTVLIALLLAFCSAHATQPDPMAPPQELIRNAANNVLDAIRNDRELKSGSIDRVNQAVDELILPYVDFEKTTRLAVGRGWRDATPEQRQSLVKEFRGMLIRTYAGAVSTITPEAKVDMRPFRAEPGATDVVVRTLVSDGRREPVQVDYRLEKTDQGWKIYDLNVLGVWFIQNYRNQFAPIISRSGVDGLIKALADRNQQIRMER